LITAGLSPKTSGAFQLYILQSIKSHRWILLALTAPCLLYWQRNRSRKQWWG